MQTTTAATVTSGTRVRYHGSIAAEHGPAVVLGVCDCAACIDHEDRCRWMGDPTPAPRYEVATSTAVLRCARRESFTVTEAQA